MKLQKFIILKKKKTKLRYFEKPKSEPTLKTKQKITKNWHRLKTDTDLALDTIKKFHNILIVFWVIRCSVPALMWSSQ